MTALSLTPTSTPRGMLRARRSFSVTDTTGTFGPQIYDASLLQTRLLLIPLVRRLRDCSTKPFFETVRSTLTSLDRTLFRRLLPASTASMPSGAPALSHRRLPNRSLAQPAAGSDPHEAVSSRQRTATARATQRFADARSQQGDSEPTAVYRVTPVECYSAIARTVFEH